MINSKVALTLATACWWLQLITAAVDTTIEENTSGKDVVIASINKIQTAQIFDKDEGMLRRIAYTETKDGTDADTYSTDGYHGGIWRLSEEKFLTTKRVDMVILDKIRQSSELGINWTATEWRDLRKPLWSALAARLYLTRLTTIPLSVNHDEQANYWFTQYHTTSTAGRPALSTADYLNTISYLAENEGCGITGMDLFFVLDQSGSVGYDHYQLMKNFVNDLIDSFPIGQNNVRVGLMAFNSGYTIHFTLGEYNNASSLKQAVTAIPYRGGGTNTAGALQATRQYAFTEANGGRSIPGLPKVVVVVTDGYSNSFSDTLTAAAELHNEGILVFAIGIAGANIDELNVIATRPSYAALIDTFDSELLGALQVDVSEAACTVSPEVSLNETVNSTISEKEIQYLNYHLPSNTTGITLIVDVQSGKIILYASSSTENPNEANHEIKIITDNFTDIFINASELSNPNAERIFIALQPDENQNTSSTFTVDAQPGDVSTKPLKAMISEVRPGTIKDVTSVINVRCLAAGKPLPMIQWFKDSVELVSSQKINIVTVNGSVANQTIISSILSVSYLDVRDTGLYSCNASHTLPSGQQRVLSDSVELNVTSSSIFILPDTGNMLGGTLVKIRGLFFPNMTVGVKCVFGDQKTIGIIVSETEAMCISPRFHEPGSKRFLLYLDDKIVKTDQKMFHATHYSDLADVKVLKQNSDTGILIVGSGEEVTIKWNKQSLSNDNMGTTKVMVKVFEADICEESIYLHYELVLETIPNIANGRFRLPDFPQPPRNADQCQGQLKSPYSLVLVKLIIDPSSGNNKYYNAISNLRSISTEPGIWSHVLFRKVLDNTVTPANGLYSTCMSWYTPGQYHDVNLTNLAPCPCTETQAEKPFSGYKKRDTEGKKIIDSVLHGTGSTCYVQNGNSFNASQKCCYAWDRLVAGMGDRSVSGSCAGSCAGSANVYYDFPSTWEKHAIYNLVPFLICCISGTQCSLYYAKRPSRNCIGYTPNPSGGCNGDPHVRTIDGFQYTFNGRGEFILLTTDVFTLQGRMESITTPDGSSSLGTVFSAIAAKQTDSDMVEFRNESPLPTMHINGIQTEIPTGQSKQYQRVTISAIVNNTLRATFSSGVSLEVEQNNNFLSSVSLSVPRSYNGLTKGLMGVYNDDQSDDLLPRYSTTPLPLNITMENLHNDFGLTWIIDNQSESLFTYESTNDFQRFYDPSFTPVFSPTFSDPLLEQEAAEICMGDLSCLFDIAVTGNTEIGKDTLQQQLIVKERIRLASLPVICTPPCEKGFCVANDTCTCYSGYKGDLCDAEDICAYNPSPVQCEEAIAGWIYNSDSGMCEFGGCKGRGNIFTTMAKCVKNCGGCSMTSDNQTSSECLVNPCHYSSCEAFPHANCEVDACNPCETRFTSGTKEVTDICKLTCENSDRNTKLKPTDCVVQPCEVTLCPNYPNAVCLPDYCKGCEAKFLNSFDVEVTDKCTSCPRNKPALKCPHNLCHYQKCHNIPDATCLLDTCGVCKAKFYLNGADVTDQCDFCEVKGQTFHECGSACSKTCSNYSENRDCLGSCSPRCQCPANMVLDEQKNECVLIENCPCICDSLPANCPSVVIPNSNNTCSCPICEECPEGQVFQGCTSCPRTCSEQSDTLFKCSSECKAGCQCPDGKLLDDLTSSCVIKESCKEPDHCALPALKGPCKGNIRRYFYNREAKKCDLFKYGGCLGNKNNFFSLHDCELSCSDLPPTCSPLFCIIQRNSICTLRDSVNNQSTQCPNFEASNCRACYYSPTTLSSEEETKGALCDMNCVKSNGEYDEKCLKEWGNCLKRKFASNVRSVPLSERIPENFKCFKYNGCNNQ